MFEQLYAHTAPGILRNFFKRFECQCLISDQSVRVDCTNVHVIIPPSTIKLLNDSSFLKMAAAGKAKSIVS